MSRKKETDTREPSIDNREKAKALSNVAPIATGRKDRRATPERHQASPLDAAPMAFQEAAAPLFDQNLSALRAEQHVE